MIKGLRGWQKVARFQIGLRTLQVCKKKKNCRRRCRVKRTFETNDTYIYVWWSSSSILKHQHLYLFLFKNTQTAIECIDGIILHIIGWFHKDFDFKLCFFHPLLHTIIYLYCFRQPYYLAVGLVEVSKHRFTQQHHFIVTTHSGGMYTPLTVQWNNIITGVLLFTYMLFQR